MSFGGRPDRYYGVKLALRLLEAALPGRHPLPESIDDRDKLLVGVGVPARRDPRWRPPRSSTFDVLSALERVAVHRAADGARALAAALRALERIGGNP